MGSVLGTQAEHQAPATKVNKASWSFGSLQNSSEGVFLLPTCSIEAVVKASSPDARLVQKLDAVARAQPGTWERDAMLPWGNKLPRDILLGGT